jgi:hypothetical protein
MATTVEKWTVAGALAAIIAVPVAILAWRWPVSSSNGAEAPSTPTSVVQPTAESSQSTSTTQSTPVRPSSLSAFSSNVSPSAPPPASLDNHAIRKEGSIVLTSGHSVDLDSSSDGWPIVGPQQGNQTDDLLLSSGAASAATLWAYPASPGMRGARMAVLGQTSVDYGTCASTIGGGSPIDLSALDVGTEICVSTNGGHVVALRLESVSLANPSATFQVVVWQ